MTSRRALPLSVVAMATMLVLSACGGSDDGSSASSSAPTEGTWSVSDCATLEAPSTGAPLPPDAVVEGEVATTATVDTAPIIGVLEGAVNVTTLVVSDVVSGSGEEIAPGATVTVQYCGVGLDSGAVFDSSWARGEPATFPLAGVIAGWQEGIPGMQTGGRRLLLIPGDLAYGDTPPPGSGILPGETLVFVVDMLPTA
jgi:peptidylprolyl isomerase